jgi:chromosome segregation ATPase
MNKDHTPPTQAELVAKLREMASQILTPSSKGKHFFNECANELDRLTKEVEELRKDFDWLGAQNILLEEVQDLFTEHDSLREAVRLARSAMQQKGEE